MARYFFSRFFGPASGGGGGSPPAAPTLSVEDEGDGTGAEATITSDGGATNTVYVSPFSGLMGGGVWSSAGSRVGSGTLALSLAVGHYLGYTLSETAGGAMPSAPVYFVVTDEASPVHFRCLDAIVARLQALGLDGIASGSIIAQHVPSTRRFFASTGETPELTKPGIIVSPWGSESHNPNDGTNYRDVLGYPCLVTFIASQLQHQLDTELAKRLLWRETAIKAFRNQRIEGVPEVEQAFVEPLTIVSPDVWLENLWHSAFIVRCRAQQTRGF